MNLSPANQLEIPLVAETAARLSLEVQTESGARQQIPCRHIVTLLGSRAGCKFVLQHKKINPVHVALVHTGPHVYAVDLLSNAGTKLNQLTMLFERLNHDDVLSVGPWQFRVRIEGPERNGNADVHPFGLEPTPQIIALEHLPSRRVLRLDREVCIIGRRSGADINVADHTMSRAHALVFSYYGHPVIVDLLSRNRTYVNDEPISFQVLKNDDLLTLGEARFRVRLVGSITVDRLSKDVENTTGAIKVARNEMGPDLIDIKATEGSQRWHIAESFAKAAGESA